MQNHYLDPQMAEQEARRILPLRALMQRFGDGPSRPAETWKKFRCPFCSPDGKAKAGLFSVRGDLELFKCFRTDCPSGAKAMAEPGYLALKKGVSTKEGWKEWIKMAGLWRERNTQ